jgi:hypothetical protein
MSSSRAVAVASMALAGALGGWPAVAKAQNLLNMGITVREVEVEAGHLVVQTADHRAHRSTGARFGT